MEKKIIKPKQINTVPIRQHRNALGCKMVLNCDKAPGVPKAFLGFLFKKKKKNAVNHRRVCFFSARLPPDSDLLWGLGVSRQNNEAFDNL